MDLSAMGLLALIIAAETIAQYLLEKASKSSPGPLRMSGHLLLGVAGYVAIAIAYMYLLKTGEKLALANNLWNAGTAISVTAIGYLVFKQELDKKQLAGIALTMAGVWLLS